MKVWLTGAAGLLGAAQEAELSRTKIPFVATSREDLDLTDKAAVSDFVSHQQPTHIINCAAYTNVDAAEHEIDAARRGNVLVPDVLSDTGCRLIHFSTDYVFDGAHSAPYVENDPTRPINIYGASKREGEQLLLEKETPGCIIRTAGLFGRGGRNFVQTIAGLLDGDQTLNVVNDQLSLPTYAPDLARATMKLLNADGIIHFTNSGVGQSWFDLAEAIRTRLGFPKGRIVACDSKKSGRPASRPNYSVLDSQHYHDLTGERPPPWQEALDHYLAT